MALRVGIHKNLVLLKTEKNQKGNLEITFKQAGEVDPLAVLNSGSTTSMEQQEGKITFYAPNVEIGGNKKDDTAILDEVNDLRNQLTHILSQYVTSDKIKWDITFGTGITKENLMARIQVQDTVNKIYNNLVDQFIQQMTSFVGGGMKKVNVKFIRQSKAKNYLALPKRYLDSQPFIEPADVPVSKLKYSKWETDNGLHLPDVVDNKQQVSEEDSKTASALFKR